MKGFDMFDNAEDCLSIMTAPILATELLLKIIDDYVSLDNVTILHNSQQEKDRNVSALLYALNLVQNNIDALRKDCYNNLYSNK